MPQQLEISPNEPDIVPEYVDASPRPEPSSPAPSPAIQDRDETHRVDECVPNTPDIPPEVVAEDAVARDSQAAAAEVDPGPEAAAKPWWFRWHTLAVVLVAAGFGVMVFSQTISALALASTLPRWAQYMLLIPFGVCCLALVGVIIGLARSWLRLRAHRQIDLDALEELRHRAQTRRDGLEHFQAAKQSLHDYLASYPLEGADARRLRSAGVDTQRMASLAKEREILLNQVADSRTWLEDFRSHFQEGLDAAAAARIKSWSLKAAGCVMASPLPLLDAVLILSIALKMIRDLCVVYNVRTNRAGSLVLLNRAIFTAFVAGVAEEALEAAGGMAAEELSGMLGESAAAGLGGSLARVVAPKLGEGALNAFFIHRLGKATVRLLQPLKP